MNSLPSIPENSPLQVNKTYQIKSEVDVRNLEKGAKVGKLKYLSAVRSKIINTASKLGTASKVLLFGAGLAGALLIGLKLAGAAVALASLGTPLGWAMGGCLIVGLGLLFIRHQYLKSKDLPTESLKQLGESGMAFAGGLFVPLMVWAFFSGAGDLGLGTGSAGADSVSQAIVVNYGLEAASAGGSDFVPKEDGSNRKVDKQQTTLFLNDTVTLQKDGNIRINKPPK